VRFVSDKEVLRQVSLPVLRVYTVSIVPALFNTYLHLNTTVTRRTSGRSLRTSKQGEAVRMSEEQGLEKPSLGG
jgi:hypothetical protein